MEFQSPVADTSSVVSSLPSLEFHSIPGSSGRKINSYSFPLPPISPRKRKNSLEVESPFNLDVTQQQLSVFPWPDQAGKTGACLLSGALVKSQDIQSVESLFCFTPSDRGLSLALNSPFTPSTDLFDVFLQKKLKSIGDPSRLLHPLSNLDGEVVLINKGPLHGETGHVLATMYFNT